MPDFRFPGVFIDEPVFPPVGIPPQSGDATLFVGPTRRGPSASLAGSVTIRNLADYERMFGMDADLGYLSTAGTGHLFHAARAFFDEGGRELHIARVVGAGAGFAGAVLTSAAAGTATLFRCAARFAGEAGNAEILLRETRLPADRMGLTAAPPGSMVAVGGEAYFIKTGNVWHPVGDTSRPDIGLARLLANSPELVSLEVEFANADGERFVYPDLGFERAHPRWLGTVLGPNPADPRAALYNPVGFDIGPALNGLAIHQAIFKGVRPDRSGVRVRQIELVGGSDGAAPDAGDYAKALRDMPPDTMVSLLAAPGSSAYPEAQAIAAELIRFAETPGSHRMALLDLPPKLAPDQVDIARRHWDSDRAVAYYPWVTVKVPGPAGRSLPLDLPPSGFLCGLYARSDRERGLWKAPANLALRSAAGLERRISDQEHALLNPIGVNCLREIRNRGFLVWGARTLSSDPEWRYIATRRYADFLQASIEAGCRWAVFEPNDESLWARLRATVVTFLDQQWRQGALMGDRPDDAYFVRCDRSTMTQDDIDNGRLVCLLGVALLRPAEFVVMRLQLETTRP